MLTEKEARRILATVAQITGVALRNIRSSSRLPEHVQARRFAGWALLQFERNSSLAARVSKLPRQHVRIRPNYKKEWPQWWNEEFEKKTQILRQERKDKGMSDYNFL